jgi:hypothetical protein
MCAESLGVVEESKLKENLSGDSGTLLQSVREFSLTLFLEQVIKGLRFRLRFLLEDGAVVFRTLSAAARFIAFVSPAFPGFSMMNAALASMYYRVIVCA